MKTIGIWGSTGSIGTQTLEIVRNNPDLRVAALAADKNVTLIEQQIREFHPSQAVLFDEEAASDLKERTADLDITIGAGMDGLLAMAAMPEIEMMVSAVVGMIGIRPTLAAIRAGKDIALANKETLVTAGHLIMPLAEEIGVSVLPVDSEHSAIFQSLQGQDRANLSRILLTASGGPFRGKKKEELAGMTAAEALQHPNWSMGKKVTIDSATLVNKGLEVMEARWLFDVPLSKIKVLVHPQSILHSAVEFADGAIIGQMGLPDMKLPIQYALFYPERRFLPGKRADLAALGALTFEEPDTETFPGLSLAMRAAEAGGSMPTVFNAANERAVALFLDGKIAFPEIAEQIESAMGAHHVIENPTLEQILETEAETRAYMEQTKH